jgi:hypothetical protein
MALYRRSSVGCRSAHPGFLAVDFDPDGRVQAILSDSSRLRLGKTLVAAIVHECLDPYPGLDLGALKHWRGLSCTGASGLIDNALHGPTTAILHAPEDTVTIVTSHSPSTCRYYSEATRASRAF